MSDILMIEVKHSRWGLVKLQAKLETHPTFPKPIPLSVCFYYPNGEYMGSWDPERGGGLGHPNIEVNRFLRTHADKLPDLLDLDEVAYLELEDLLEKEVRKKWPDFFTVEEYDRSAPLTAPEGHTRLVFNFDHLEQANDEVHGTTYYGGFITVNGQMFPVSGNDRQGAPNDTIVQAVETVMGRKLSGDESDKLFEHEELGQDKNCVVILPFK